jgi:hypothetical protein
VSATTTAPRRVRCLGRYADESGQLREVVRRAGAAGSVLVIDRDLATRAEERLVAHLGADEPEGNAVLICDQYLKDARRLSCRPVTVHDVLCSPFQDLADAVTAARAGVAARRDGDAGFAGFRLCELETGMSIPELRWTKAGPAAPAAVSLREAIAQLESYEPLCTLTRRALAANAADPGVSTVVVAAELERVLESPIVLNRRLREAVLELIRRERVSMSEIAIRCGRVKRDRNGNLSGETSWLARRLGLLPEGGQGAPTRWIHSDVLALIAREGLGVAPREVELG